MTGEELKEALMNKYPVCSNGIEYKCVNAIIYRNKDGKILVSAELLDRNERSVTIAPLDNIKKKGD
jgi:hypothetical protein